jgi:hypothetical protein
VQTATRKAFRGFDEGLVAETFFPEYPWILIMMNKKKAFDPGQPVTSFTGHSGMVLSEDEYLAAKQNLREGGKPGRYFAPGCCAQPDYISQIPVLFEDGTFDVMRSMNIKKTEDLPEEKRKRIRGVIDSIRE